MDRIPRRDDVKMVPEPVEADPGLFVVDGTWGTVTPIELAEGVKTIGELELIDRLKEGRWLVDSRLRHFFDEGTIPGAVSIPHDEVLDHLDELPRDHPSVFFCNGPQCKATPDSVQALLGAGFPAGAIEYYRGGLHDWMTLGYPIVAP